MARQVTQAELAQLHGVSHVTIRNWEHEGMPVAKRGRSGVSGKYDVAATVEWRVAREVGKVEARQNKQKLNIEDERARLVKEQADAQALKNEVSRGRLLDIDVVVMAWAEQIANAKSQFRAVKSKLKTRLPKLTTKELNLIGGLIDQGCNQLAEMDAPYISKSLEAGLGDVESSASADA